jgi:hypothetical protein
MPFMDSGNLLIWQALKLYLPPRTILTSCRRPPSEQLAFITKTAQEHGYRFETPPTLENRDSWQPALEFVRRKGFKVAAPGSSMHQRGLAYDLSGPNLDAIFTAVQKAIEQKRIRLVAGSRTNLLMERRNNCVHVEIEGGILDFEPFEIA